MFTVCIDSVLAGEYDNFELFAQEQFAALSCTTSFLMKPT
jgi:hypothetical protein